MKKEVKSKKKSVIPMLTLIVVLVLGAYFLKNHISKEPFQVSTSRVEKSVQPRSGLVSLDPPQEGYVWENQTDWDSSLVKRCLSSTSGEEIDLDYLEALKATKIPDGYQWTFQTTTNQKEGYELTMKACITRMECPFGKIENSKECKTTS